MEGGQGVGGGGGTLPDIVWRDTRWGHGRRHSLILLGGRSLRLWEITLLDNVRGVGERGVGGGGGGGEGGGGAGVVLLF